jgi:hypothetical protein
MASHEPTVPLRPDGWPDWLGRRPMSAADREQIAQALAEPVPATPGTDPGPFLCYLTIEGLDREANPRRAMRLRGRINAAARAAAEDRRTTYHATSSTITIGIYGPDAAERINALHQVVVKLGAKHGWTVRQQAR